MRKSMFAGFFLLNGPTGHAQADGRERGRFQAPKPSQEQSLQALIAKVTARFSEGDDNWRADFISALERAVDGPSVVLCLQHDMEGARRESVRDFVEKVIRAGDTVEQNRLEAAIDKLADVMIPDEMGIARGLLAGDNLEIRDAFIAKVPCLTSKEVGRLAGHSESNPHATAARWKKSNEIFSVSHRGAERFPAFQFRDGRPHPTIRQVLAGLPRHLTAWQTAFWFVSTNGWLNDKAPVDVLDDLDAIVAAAAREVEGVMG